MDQIKKYTDRYPGIRSFEPEEQSVFFGRSEEASELFNLIKLRPLLVLFSRSGLGKTSLLKAGLSPMLFGKRFFPIFIRVQDVGISPVQTLLNELEPFVNQPLLSRFGQGKALLWEAFRAAEFKDSQGRAATPVLLFDQFEELFSHPPETQQALAAQLADLAEERLPEAVQNQLEAIPRRSRREEQRAWFTPPTVKLLFAVRSDRISGLHQLRSHFPSILHARYELQALGHAQAEQAVIRPASIEGALFSTLPFTYSDASLEDILQNLSNQRGEIESFQLQIICQHIENIVCQRQMEGEREVVVTSEDLGGARGIRNIHKNYYENQLHGLAPEERPAARRLIEEGLIIEGRRISVAEAVVKNQFRIGDELLAKLIGSRLIRPENTRLGLAYEISHDTLVAPILEAFDKRRLQEEREAAERQLWEQQARLEEEQARFREERRKRRRNRNLAIAAILLAVMATAAMGYAMAQRKRADQKTEETENARRKAEEARNDALLANDSLLVAKAAAEEAQQRAEEQKRQAEKAKARAEREKTKAEQARQQATAAARTAREQGEKAESASRRAQREKEQALLAQRIAVAASQAEERARDSIQRLLLEKEAETQKAEAQYLRAESALNSLENTKNLIARPTLLMVEEDIGRLNYDSALAKLQLLSDFIGEYSPLALAMMEMTFYYGESGQLEKAVPAAQSAARAAGKPQLAEKLSLLGPAHPQARNQLKGLLRQLYPARFDSLSRRYYPELAPVQGGTFYLGCTGPDCASGKFPEVTLSGFKMAETETTVRQYHLFVESTRREMPPPPPWGWQGDNPMVAVSWYDALAYANWLSLQMGQEPAYRLNDIPQDANRLDQQNLDWQKVWDRGANGFRLPTEAEWEYTAQGGRQQDGSKYSGSNTLEKVAWHIDNSQQKTQPVALLGPVRPGLPIYDMSGNCWEWCWDYYQNKIPPTRLSNPSGPDKVREVYRVVRGGSWKDSREKDFRATSRSFSIPASRQYYDGFRVAQNN